MRKKNPNQLREAYATELDDLIAYFERVESAIQGTQHEMADMSRLAESTFVSAYVSLEGMLSLLFLTYLNRDPRPFQQFHDTRIRQSVTEKYGAFHADRIAFSSRQHIPVDELSTAVDPKQFNITFSSAANMMERAGQILAVAHRNRINLLTAHDERVFDTAKKIRDCLSHRSPSSFTEMNARLATINQGPPNTDLGRGANEVHAVGSFLKAETATERRVILYLRRFRTISQTV